MFALLISIDTSKCFDRTLFIFESFFIPLNVIYRDIKPANFVIGIGEQGSGIVFCVDFGLSKRYRHPKTLQHIPHRDGRSLTGTPRYASINNHLGIEQSRRDDLESIGYVLVYFLKGILPWQGLKAKNAQKKYQLILQKKQQISVSALCQGCPAQFAEFLAYTRSLKFDSKPDIPYLRKLFRDLYISQGFGASSAANQTMWDWANYDENYLSTPSALASGGGAGGAAGAAGKAEYLEEDDDMIVDDGEGGGIMGGEHEEEELQRPLTTSAIKGTATSSSAMPSTSWAEYQDHAPVAPSGWGFAPGQAVSTTNVVTRSQINNAHLQHQQHQQNALQAAHRRPHSANMPPQKQVLSSFIFCGPCLNNKYFKHHRVRRETLIWWRAPER